LNELLGAAKQPNGTRLFGLTRSTRESAIPCLIERLVADEHLMHVLMGHQYSCPDPVFSLPDPEAVILLPVDGHLLPAG